MNFKAGDVVVRTGESVPSKNMYHGSSYTIEQIIGHKAYFEGNSFPFNICNFVKPNSETEIANLVRLANEGSNAVETLNRLFPGKVEYSTDASFEWRTHGSVMKYEYRIKPEIKFDEFIIGPNWLVKLNDDSLQIGCETFSAKQFVSCSKIVGQALNTDVVLKNFKVTGTRYGVEWSNYKLSWMEVDVILEALEKVGIK